jgi:hypothetical protein
VVLNMTDDLKSFVLKLNNREKAIRIPSQGLQTILIKAENI